MSRGGGGEEGRDGRIRESIEFEWNEFRKGFKNALSIFRAAPLFFSSGRVRWLALQCFVLNGVIFLGSIICFDYIARPAIRLLAEMRPSRSGMFGGGENGEDDDTRSSSDLFRFVEAIVEIFATALFNFLWIVPAYAVSFVLNAVWYQEIAEIAFASSDPETKRMHNANVLSLIAEEIYRIPLMVAVLLEAQLIGIIFGSCFAFVLLTWVYAYYCFEYKWTLLGWSLQRRLGEIERRWMFYAGFGAPPTLATYFFPTFVSTGIFALIFPLFILTAMSSDTPFRDSAFRLPIFGRSTGFVNLLLSLGPCRRFVDSTTKTAAKKKKKKKGKRESR